MESLFTLFFELLEISFILGVIAIVIILCGIWLFIKSAIAKGVEDGYYNALVRYDKTKNNPRPTPQEELEEELKNW